MKKLLFVCALFLGLAFTSDDGTILISGQIVSGTSPVSQAKVVCLQTSSSYVTGESGKFQVRGLKNAPNTIRVTYSSGATSIYPIAPSSSDISNLSLGQ